MKLSKTMTAASLAALMLISCTMKENPLLQTSTHPYQAPAFDKIKIEHYKHAFIAAIEEAKAEIQLIADNTE